MNSLTIKARMTMWVSILLFIIVALVWGIMISVSTNIYKQNVLNNLTGTIASNSGEITYCTSIPDYAMNQKNRYIKYGSGFLQIDDHFCKYFNGVYTALYDENGTLLYGENPISPYIEDTKLKTNTKSVKAYGEDFLVHDSALKGKNLEKLWLRGTISEQDGLTRLAKIIRSSLYLLPLLAVILVLGVYLIVRHGLKPVETINETARNIGSGEDLSQRIDLKDGHDELHSIASTYNMMFDRLETSFNKERQFTSDASHELRTPAAVILAQCEYSLEKPRSEDEYVSALLVIQRQGYKLSKLITQLLAFSRMQKGTYKMQMEELDLSQLTEVICTEFADVIAFNDKNITLEEDIQACIETKTDKTLYIRMLNNLISNAYQYGVQNGKIRVHLAAEGDSIYLTVEDDGIGISSENITKIWDRFYQVDSSRTESGKGSMGLGLSMVKEIINLLNGEISVKSELGRGTIFTITLKKQSF